MERRKREIKIHAEFKVFNSDKGRRKAYSRRKQAWETACFINSFDAAQVWVIGFSHTGNRSAQLGIFRKSEISESIEHTDICAESPACTDYTIQSDPECDFFG